MSANAEDHQLPQTPESVDDTDSLQPQSGTTAAYSALPNTSLASNEPSLPGGALSSSWSQGHPPYEHTSHPYPTCFPEYSGSRVDMGDGEGTLSSYQSTATTRNSTPFVSYGHPHFALSNANRMASHSHESFSQNTGWPVHGDIPGNIGQPFSFRQYMAGESDITETFNQAHNVDTMSQNDSVQSHQYTAESEEVLIAQSSVSAQHIQNPSARPLKCLFQPYGCTSLFSLSSKNEWKRHIKTQHLKIEGYRCNKDSCRSTNKIFQRKDHFSLHIKRRHGEVGKEAKEEMMESCYINNRDPPSMAICVHCHTGFSEPKVWDQKLDHISRQHPDTLGEMKIEEDEYLCQWLIEEGILVTVDGKLVLAKR